MELSISVELLISLELLSLELSISLITLELLSLELSISVEWLIVSLE